MGEESEPVTAEQARVAIACPKCDGEMIRESYESMGYDDYAVDPFAWYWTCPECGLDMEPES